MLETQRPINKLRATFIARKSGNLNENGEKSFNKLNTTKKSIGNYIVTK